MLLRPLRIVLQNTMHNMFEYELSKEFEETVEAARQMFYCAKRSKMDDKIFCGICLDQAVGIVRDILTNKRIEDNQRTDIKGMYVTKPELRRLILVLESPHVDEFDKEGNPLGPAHGSARFGTANGIIHYLESIIGSLCDGFFERELIFVNAIQFQCSQGLKLRGKRCEFNREQKDLVFEKLLDCKSFVDDFIVRLKNVYRCDCGDIVVNVVGLNSLASCKVGRLIQNVTGQCSCGIGHPSAWHVSKQNASKLAREIFKKSE